MDEVIVKWEHYVPTGHAKITFMRAGGWCKHFEVRVRGDEKQTERVVNKLIRNINKLELGFPAVNYSIHKIDQIVAQQREWDNEPRS